MTLEWSFKLAFGFDLTDGFFLYTYPHEDPTEEESEFFVRADFNMPVPSTNAKLLYFLNLGITDLNIAFGMGLFVNIDKAHGMRSADSSGSVRYGRLTLSDINNKVPVKDEIFVVCVTAAAGLTADDFVAELDVPIPNLSSVKPWIPKLIVGGSDIVNQTSGDIINQKLALQAIVKRELSTRRGSDRRSLLQPVDRRRLESSIPSGAHRGLRMLCVDEIDNLDIDCPVNTAAGEFACVRISDVRLDVASISEMLDPILRKLVNPPTYDGLFDEIAKPLEVLEKRLPGISEVAGKKTTFLDVAEALVGPSCGADTVRTILNLWRGMRTLAKFFDDANDDGILLADSCIYKPGQERQCEGGAVDFATDDGTRRMLELAQEMEDVFPSYDLSGQRITTVHSHYRMLTTGCTAIFTVPDCSGDCTSCFGEGAKSKCESRKMRCKASSTGGISFPFMSDLASSLLGLFSGDDFDIMEFRPPPMLFMFEKEITIFLFAPPVINLVLGFGASAAVEYALVRKNRVLFAAYSFSPCCGAQMLMIGTLL
jgi:hypothetical protein